MADDTRRHHYVPACYLRLFSIPQDRYAGRLYVYDRQTGRPFPSTPDKSAHERDFYRVELEGTHPNAVEKAYGELEARFAPVLAEISARGTLPANPDAMGALLAFVATQAARTPRVRRLQDKAYSEVMMFALRGLGENKPAFMRKLRELDPALSPEELEEIYATNAEFVGAEGARIETDESRLIADVLDLTADIEEMLAERTWILARSIDGTSIITSDEPVQLFWTSEKPRAPWRSPGFGSPDAAVSVPLSPQLLLLGIWGPSDRARLRLDRTKVAELNRATAHSAHRFVYSTEPRFAQMTESGSVVDGPTDELRFGHAISPAAP